MGQEVSPLWGPAGVPVNAGAGPHFDVLEIGHDDFVALINADTAFWVLAPRDEALDYLLGAELPQIFLEKEAQLTSDLNNVRFGLLPSAVYFNPTERCNLDCGYCYLPREARRSRRPHGAGPRSWSPWRSCKISSRAPCRRAPGPSWCSTAASPCWPRTRSLPGSKQYGDYFRFGVQTNATLLDQEAKDFLVAQGVGIGMSLDGPTAEVADRTRRTWGGTGVFAETVKALEDLVDYPGLNVITTVTKENVRHLPELVEFLHARGVGNALLNPVRGTQTGGRDLMPDQAELAHFFFKALDRTYELAQETGQKAGHRQLRQPAVGAGGPGGPAAHVRHLALRRRALLLCGGRQRRSGPVQRIPGPAGVPRRQPLGARRCRSCWQTPPFKQVTTRVMEGFAPCNALRGAPLLRGALPGGGLCHQRAPGRPGAPVRLLHRPGPLRLPGHRPGPPGRLPLGRLERRPGRDRGDVGIEPGKLVEKMVGAGLKPAPTAFEEQLAAVSRQQAPALHLIR